VLNAPQVWFGQVYILVKPAGRSVALCSRSGLIGRIGLTGEISRNDNTPQVWFGQVYILVKPAGRSVSL